MEVPWSYLAMETGRGGWAAGREIGSSAVTSTTAQIKAFPCRFKFKFSIKKDIKCTSMSSCREYLCARGEYL